MGMSTHVYGFREPNDHWRRMQAVWKACVDAGIEIPGDVDAFFDGEVPDDSGVRVKLPSRAVRPYSEDMQEGYEVVLDELPEDLTTIRFVNSY